MNADAGSLDESAAPGPSLSEVVVDTTVIIAVLTNEGTKKQILETTMGCALLAPSSLDIEVGNAFSRMFKRNRISFEDARKAIEVFHRIPITRIEVDLQSALQLSHELNVYAYDAYVIHCAIESAGPLISLDGGLLEACRRVDVKTIEVTT